jgi:hypothetical protein
MGVIEGRKMKHLILIRKLEALVVMKGRTKLVVLCPLIRSTLI